MGVVSKGSMLEQRGSSRAGVGGAGRSQRGDGCNSLCLQLITLFAS